AALRQHLAAVPLFFMAYHIFRTRGQMQRALAVIALISLALALIALMQYARGPAWTAVVFPGADSVDQSTFFVAGQDVWRPPSTTGGGGGAATWMQVAFPAALAVCWPGMARLKSLVFWIPGLIAMVVTLLLSSVRAMAGASLAEVALLIVLWQSTSGGLSARVKRLQFVGLAAIISVVALAGWRLGFSASSGIVAQRFAGLQNPVAFYATQRGHNVLGILDTVSNFPLGAGLGRTGGAAATFHAWQYTLAGLDTGTPNGETYFSAMIAETGIPGMLVIMVITGVFVVQGVGTVRRLQDPRLRLIAITLVALIAGIALTYWAGPSLYLPPLSIYFWFAAGLITRLRVAGEPAAAG
ncbi:MAG: hypothetical protein JO247_22180, partial [Chloroflexi bacterium]|nr:hypothetical protein [Chloroflexota bacterium]